MTQRAEVVIWQEIPNTIAVQTMYCLYDNGLISEITSTETGTTSRHVETWQFEERVQFSMFVGFEIEFKTVSKEYKTNQTAKFCRTDAPASC